MSKKIGVFISSKMQELREERRAMAELLPTLGDETLQLHPWVFEADAPASDSSIREVYMKALDESELYIGLFWNEYGEWTIDEFHRAGELGITRHLYVKNVNPEQRDPRLEAFLEKQSDVRFGITPRWYTDVDDLKAQVTRSVEQWLLERQIASHSATSAILAEIADDIPELPRRLIGREGLIEEVTWLLDDNERVLLRGFGGMGKSALAATIAAEHIDAGKGPVIWVKAGAAGADAIFEALGQVFEAQQEIAGTTGDARVQAVRHLLVEQMGALLVLDDVWNGNALLNVVKAVPRQMPLLVTSRQRFPLDEIIEVGELKSDEAIKLLNYHVRRSLDDDPDALQLCEALGNHAFALEIAGKTLKVYDISPAELLQRIEEAPHDLSMPAGFGELGRRGIKSLLDASIDALTRELLDVFVTYGGLFEPTATSELVALTMHCDEPEMDQWLQALMLRGLVNERKHKDVRYYRMHDLAYSYAKTMFVNKGLSQHPVIEACWQFVGAHRTDLDVLDIEQSNILEAAEAAHQAGQENIFVDVMRLMTVDGPYFAARGHTSRSLVLLETSIDVALERDQLETAHYLLSRLGNTYADFIGDRDEAINAYSKALELARELGLPSREAILLTVLGKMYFLKGADDADHYYEQAEQIARSHNDDQALAFVLHHRGFYEIKKPDPNYENGRRLSDEAAEIAARLQNEDVQFFSLVNRGGCELELGLLDEALSTHQEAYELAQARNNHPWMAYALQSIGEDYDILGARERAQEAFDQALDLWRQTRGEAQASELTEYMSEHDYEVRPT